MRADLELFRERIDEARARDEAAAANRGRAEPAAAVSPELPPPRPGADDDDDEFYRPRSWLV
ncbi:hypothetical protein ACFTZB_20815 [Rhodococcus sp. NPDC057014]|uniref:hypothetical protein n=1 Tax=unclassified Rhodococcus (in: high G+C Gram-positive bacteria) TaxID=192944 RepID=UPI0036273072